MSLFRRKPRDASYSATPNDGTIDPLKASLIPGPINGGGPISYGGFPDSPSYGGFPIADSPPGSYGGFPGAPSYGGFPPPTYGGFPPSNDPAGPVLVNGDPLHPLIDYPGQYVNGQGNGAQDPITGNSAGEYSVYDSRGNLLGTNMTVTVNGSTTNYGYSYGTPLPQNIDLGATPGSSVFNPTPSYGNIPDPSYGGFPPPSYIGFPVGTTGATGQYGTVTPDDQHHFDVASAKSEDMMSSPQPAAQTSYSTMQFVSGTNQHSAGPDYSRVPAGFTVQGVAPDGTIDATIPLTNHETGKVIGSETLIISPNGHTSYSQSWLYKDGPQATGLPDGSGALPATQGMPTSVAPPKISSHHNQIVGSILTDHTGGQTIDYGSPTHTPVGTKPSSLNASYGSHAKSITVVSDNGSEIGGHPVIGRSVPALSHDSSAAPLSPAQAMQAVNPTEYSPWEAMRMLNPVPGSGSSPASLSHSAVSEAKSNDSMGMTPVSSPPSQQADVVDLKASALPSAQMAAAQHSYDTSVAKGNDMAATPPGVSGPPLPPSPQAEPHSLSIAESSQVNAADQHLANIQNKLNDSIPITLPVSTADTSPPPGIGAFDPGMNAHPGGRMRME